MHLNPAAVLQNFLQLSIHPSIYPCTHPFVHRFTLLPSHYFRKILRWSTLVNQFKAKLSSKDGHDDKNNITVLIHFQNTQYVSQYYMFITGPVSLKAELRWTTFISAIEPFRRKNGNMVLYISIMTVFDKIKKVISAL